MSLRAHGVRPRCQRAASRLGERLRQLRVSAGLTQSELAQGASRRSTSPRSSAARRARRTRPSPGSPRGSASTRPSSRAASRATSARAPRPSLARAEALTERREYDAAVDEFSQALAAVAATGAVELQVRALSGEAWARMQRGEVRPAISCSSARARSLRAPRSPTSTVPRSSSGSASRRYLISSLATALALFAEALALVERSPLPSDPLRVNILTWRSRCYRRQRDYEAAREDVERALELAESMEDAKALGKAYFEASLIAERDGHWVLARTYAERAKAQYEELSDRMNVGRLLNNLGGLEFLLGQPEQAVGRLHEAFALALEHGDDDDVATVVSSLAQVSLKTGDAARRRSTRATRCAGSATARTAPTRSATHVSCSVEHCSTRVGSTRPRPRSPRPRTPSASSRPVRIAPPPGLPRATSPPSAATTAGRRALPAGGRGAPGLPLLAGEPAGDPRRLVARPAQDGRLDPCAAGWGASCGRHR